VNFNSGQAIGVRQTVLVGGAGAIIAALLSGFLIGGAARWAVPGPDPMPFWLTVLIGLVGSAVGGGIAAAAFGAKHLLDGSGHIFVTLLLEIGAAAGLVVAYRRFVQDRPVTGREARRFPTRGIGVARLRGRLRQLGIDPDKMAGHRPVGPKQEDLTDEETAAELDKLRDLRDKGVLTNEEYEQARERFRRY
jgi:uncharacterized membrane protein YeaQ/YmgE (transglycosylase-associated protein family)